MNDFKWVAGILGRLGGASGTMWEAVGGIMEYVFLSCALSVTILATKGVTGTIPCHTVAAPTMAPKKTKADAKGKADTKGKPKKGKHASAEPVAPIAMPNVSAKEVEAAEQLLRNEIEKRRANSNMMYWLRQQNKRDNYDALTPMERKQFSLAWYAWSVKEGDTLKLTKRALGSEKKETDIGKWMCKSQIITKFGTEKGNAKIRSLDVKPERHRPDKDTGEDGEWHRENRIFEDESEATNFDRVSHELNNQKELHGETEKAEAAEDMASFKLLSGDGFVDNSAGSSDKQPERKIKVEGGLPNEDLRTFDKLKKNPKTVLRTIQDNIIEMKRMFEVAQQPGKAKYTEIIRSDITKLIPKLKADFNAVEKLHLSAAGEDSIPDPEILATSRKLDKNFEQINEITLWFRRMCPKDKDRASSSCGT